MKKVFATLAALLLVAFAAPANAGDNEHICGERDIQYIPPDSESTSYPVYVTVDEVASEGYLFSIWIYGESNGDAGIQRHDGYCAHEGIAAEAADTIIF